MCPVSLEGILGISQLDLLPKEHNTDKHVASPWSKPLLIMIQKGAEQLTTSRENVEKNRYSSLIQH
ncbi:hypothetical protein GN244_ATG20998 [Phytophthora infestans]|uniref:Uncharacterized protein n=1 Tax=Phytophthora infestans TaxID=4787 RepID=A0A833WHA9_PHYIN|nr:hypothetical protein GN244_ATG20998 [Phytophthora infestans]KAF4150795.1 hypothetical protein GN958_ATG00018 [Phytophthora infestans]KAF4150796.1 hypothetical protein GN958_ATG00019 [Phytophthora infestans]